ncbi:HupE/UreJ family protein [Pseudokineococcus sp. 1T1Z-3]|uniref:HupE/UreJ family protein n=1 Tax=Pseudokineococcus sp. 1T1Z-3 TaxID=3132745 RepID=UPI0030B2E30E
MTAAPAAPTTRATTRPRRLGPLLRGRRLAGAAGALLAGAVVLLAAAPASAHVVPSTTLTLHVQEEPAQVVADVVLPAADLVTASGVDVPTDGSPLSAPAAAEVADYLEGHVAVTTGEDAWDVAASDVATTQVEQWGTGEFAAVTATLTLTPDDPGDLRTFVLDYDAVIHQVVTADIFVLLAADTDTDTATGEGSASALGTIAVDTVTGEVAPLPVDLTGAGTGWAGFSGMVQLGVSHIAEGTDHQLFLLTLLLPAPLLVISVTGRRRWDGVVGTPAAVRRITAVTLAFTLGHSVTLAAGALGLPVPQQPVEAAIAVSILVAAAHAARPLFPGREPLVAGLFGLVHGLAFSSTLTEMDLRGGQLVLALLGFNVGIEIMQLAVVLLVLPPLMVLARTRAYRPLRDAAAVLTALAATGWLLQRVGYDTPLGGAADALGPATPWLAGALWVAALLVLAQRHRRRGAAPTAADRHEALDRRDAPVP